MSKIVAANGQIVTEKMIDDWCEVLDNDKWPNDWINQGEILDKLPVSLSNPVTLSVKIPSGMKTALVTKAQREGKSTSTYIRDILAESLLTTA